MISRIKGTQDFLDLTLFNYIITSLKKHAARYHFTEIQTPLVEYLDLFQRSLGEHTEVVSKEMFVIESRQEDSADRMCLRPEMTASIARAFNENHVKQLPWKVFSYGPCFRYERPQKGRYRQFHQISLEIIGSAVISQDAQFVAMLDRFFYEILRLSNYVLVLNFLGCSDDRAAFTKKLYQFLVSPAAQGICQQCQQRREHNIMRVFDCKNAECQAIYRSAPHITDSLCESCLQEWRQLQEQLSLLSVSFVHKPTLVRGLDYYNKTVFEFVSKNLGAQDTFCGGGRYNQLVKDLGSKEDQPSIGAGIGIERVMLLLEPIKEQLLTDSAPPLYIVIPMSEVQHSLALLLADTLRAAQLCTDVLLEGSMKSMLRKASKLGAAYVLIIGETEQQSRTVMIKNMVTGYEEAVAQKDAADYLRK